MSDLKDAARSYAQSLLPLLPKVPIEQLLELAFMEGSVHGLDCAKAVMVRCDVIANAKRPT